MCSSFRIIAFLFTTLLLFACSGKPPESWKIPWAYADLRILDEADATNPSQDVLAVYVRQVELSRATNMPYLVDTYDQDFIPYTQIRLDLLDMATRSQQDIYLALDHKTGGSYELPLDTPADIEWDTLITLPVEGPIQAIDPDGFPRQDFAILVLRDPVLDTITISINPRNQTEMAILGFRGQLFTTPPGSRTLADKTQLFHSSGSPPPPAPVLFTFWNTFPAYTPAQSLRRWDGAHTGPLGGRHGLHNLLRAARNHQIPLALLDLKTSTSLSALDYIGGIDLIRDIANQGSLILPDSLPDISLPGSFQEKVTDNSRQIALEFGLPATPFIYAPLSDGLPTGYPLVFTPYAESQVLKGNEISPVMISRWKERSVIPVPTDLPADQATLDGPSLAVREALIETALTAANMGRQSSPPILILGGDLPRSTWGEPQRARTTFEYLKAHPWIKVLDANALLSTRPFSSSSIPPTSPSSSPTIDSIIMEINNAPPGKITDAALNAFLVMFAPIPSASPELDSLREIYLRQVGMLLAAAEWDANPSSIVDCSRDLDLDKHAECILASEDMFTIFDSVEGSLLFAFAHTPSGTHQIIGPSSQFVVGLSDPSNWDLSRGFQADPSVIPGAFSDDFGPYRVIPAENSITFESNDQVKNYRLIPTGLQLEYQTSIPTNWRIPLVFDPWSRLTPSWGDTYSDGFTDKGWSWGFTSGPNVMVRASADLSSQMFIVTKEKMGRQENPNYEYPPGHYLPFPLALLELRSSTDGYVEIRFLP